MNFESWGKAFKRLLVELGIYRNFLILSTYISSKITDYTICLEEIYTKRKNCYYCSYEYKAEKYGTTNNDAGIRGKRAGSASRIERLVFFFRQQRF